jgi:hypothetical protein
MQGGAELHPTRCANSRLGVRLEPDHGAHLIHRYLNKRLVRVLVPADQEVTARTVVEVDGIGRHVSWPEPAEPPSRGHSSAVWKYSCICAGRHRSPAACSGSPISRIPIRETRPANARKWLQIEISCARANCGARASVAELIHRCFGSGASLAEVSIVCYPLAGSSPTPHQGD